MKKYDVCRKSRKNCDKLRNSFSLGESSHENRIELVFYNLNICKMFTFLVCPVIFLGLCSVFAIKLWAHQMEWKNKQNLITNNRLYWLLRLTMAVFNRYSIIVQVQFEIKFYIENSSHFQYLPSSLSYMLFNLSG